MCTVVILVVVATEEVTLSIIASPLASSKLKTQLLALVKSAAEAKQLRRGLKEVTKALRKNEKGLVVIGGDVSPVDVLTHIPILCEDNDVPYVYVPSRSELGQSAQTKRATTLVLVRVPPAGSAYAKEFDSLSKTVHNLKATVM